MIRVLETVSPVLPRAQRYSMLTTTGRINTSYILFTLYKMYTRRHLETRALPVFEIYIQINTGTSCLYEHLRIPTVYGITPAGSIQFQINVMCMCLVKSGIAFEIMN